MTTLTVGSALLASSLRWKGLSISPIVIRNASFVVQCRADPKPCRYVYHHHLHPARRWFPPPGPWPAAKAAAPADPATVLGVAQWFLPLEARESGLFFLPLARRTLTPRVSSAKAKCQSTKSQISGTGLRGHLEKGGAGTW